MVVGAVVIAGTLDVCFEPIDEWFLDVVEEGTVMAVFVAVVYTVGVLDELTDAPVELKFGIEAEDGLV